MGSRSVVHDVLFFLCAVLRGAGARQQWRSFTVPAGEDLVLAQVTDIHYGEDEATWGPAQDRKSDIVLDTLFALEPTINLVGYTGDLITGNNIHDNATVYWQMAVRDALQLKIPFFTLFGNHDDLSDGVNGTKLDMLRAEGRFAGNSSLTQTTAPALAHGVSNYVLPVYFDATSGRPSLLIFVLDTGGGQEQPAGIYEDQVQWLSGERDMWPTAIPAILFTHIPTPAFKAVYGEEKFVRGDDCWGMHNEGAGGVTPFDSGLRDVLIRKGFKAHFVGHQHGNAWCCLDHIMYLCYGRHSSRGGYNEGPSIRGVRVIRMDRSGRLETYIRQSDGLIVDRRALEL